MDEAALRRRLDEVVGDMQGLDTAFPCGMEPEDLAEYDRLWEEREALERLLGE